MHRYTAQVRWTRNDAVFTDRRYSRAHVWAFDGGLEVPASAEISALHEQSHHHCFIANSVKTKIVIDQANSR